jgi:hypothetical protein
MPRQKAAGGQRLPRFPLKPQVQQNVFSRRFDMTDGHLWRGMDKPYGQNGRLVEAVSVNY